MDVSEFPWFYSEPETFYVLVGKVRVELDEGEPVEFGKGDLCPGFIYPRWHRSPSLMNRIQ